MEREHGRIVTVSTRTLGSVLDGDHAAGVTSLLVHDAGDFDEDGGSLSIGGNVLAYSAVDDDASTITLTDPLPAAALDGDKVQCWNTLYGTTVTEKTAMVQLDGDDDNPDPIEAWVPHFLADKISDGDRGGPGESVVLGYDDEDDEWQILDVRGLAAASGAGVKFCNTDTFTVTAAGDQAIRLSHTPIDGSLDVAWGGLSQPSIEWTLDGNTLTVPDPNGLLEAGDVIDPQYAYRDGLELTLTLVPWQAANWKYLQVASTDTTDRSSPSLDDSSWATAPAAFAKVLDQPHPYGYPTASTLWDVGTRLWVRRSVTVPAAAKTVTISIRVDDTADVYWNGTNLGSVTSVKGGQTLFNFQVPTWSDSNTFAVRGTDAPSGDPTAPENWTYLDTQVTATKEAT